MRPRISLLALLLTGASLLLPGATFTDSYSTDSSVYWGGGDVSVFYMGSDASNSLWLGLDNSSTTNNWIFNSRRNGVGSAFTVAEETLTSTYGAPSAQPMSFDLGVQRDTSQTTPARLDYVVSSVVEPAAAPQVTVAEFTGEVPGGGPAISGVLLGFEDLRANMGSDYDYNDLQVLLVGNVSLDAPVSAAADGAATPEPGTMGLLAGGLAGAVLLRRRIKAA